MSRLRKTVISTVLLLAVAGGIWVVSAGGDTKVASSKDGQDAPEIPVTAVAAENRSVPVYATALGTVSALNTVTVSPQVSGQLVSLHFREGQHVKQGDVLARIDPRTLQASYDAAAATKRQNQALLATARTNFARSSSPEYQQYVSRNDLDTLRNSITQYESLVAASDANMRAAQTQLEYTQVRAPISGVAGIRHVDAGNLVSAGTPLVTLTLTHPIHVNFNLPERQLGDVRQAQQLGAVPVSVLDRSDAHALTGDGQLDVVDNLIDADSGTIKARAVFQNEDDALWPGQFVNVRLKLRTIGAGVVVPAQAVMRGPDGEYVYVVQPDRTVRMQKVKSGIAYGDSHTQISEGLKAGEQVVTEGQFRIKPGSRVIALKPGQVAASSGQAESKVAAQPSAASPR